MRIKIEKGDITQFQGDAIVNAANSSLMGGGGVDGAIHAAGGPAILDACKQLVAEQGELPTSRAVITTAGNLPAKHVIHTVGPVWKDGSQNEDMLLANAYKNSLMLAEEYLVKRIAFPNISTGVYGFPKDRAAKIALQTVAGFLECEATIVKEVVFVCFDDENHAIYQDFAAKGYAD